MPATRASLIPGTLVTVRITDTDGVEHTFHGTTTATENLFVGSYETHNDTRYNYLPDTGQDVEAGWGESSRWLHVYSATGKSFPVLSYNPYGPSHRTGDGIAPHGPDWYFGYHDFRVRIDADNVDIRVANKAGRTWVANNLSLDNRRDQAVARLKALDSALADEIERLIQDVEDAAFDRGKDAEWRSLHD